MAVNKVIYDGRTVMDISDSTVTPDTLASGKTAYNAAGEKVVGIMNDGDNGDAFNNSDWNTYITPGIYRVQGPSFTTTTMNNYHTPQPNVYPFGILQVLKSGERIVQIYYPHYPSTNTNLVNVGFDHCTRFRENDTWNSWRYVMTQGAIIDMIKELALTIK